MTGIPAHGGGKRFSTEQRLVSASIRSTLKDIDLSPLRGKKVALVFDIIADEGGGNLHGGRFNLIGGLTGASMASPVTNSASAFQLFNLNDSGTSYANTSTGGNNTASTTFISTGTSNSNGGFTQSTSGTFDQTSSNTSNGSSNNTSNGAFSQTSNANNTSNTSMNGNSTGTSTEAGTSGTTSNSNNGTSGSSYTQTATTGSNDSTTNGTNSNTNNGTFSQTNSGNTTGNNTSIANGNSTNSGSNTANGNNAQTGTYSQNGTQNSGYNNTRQAISPEASNKITQTKGNERKYGGTVDYKGLGDYQNISVPKSDASLLMGLVRNYMLLNRIIPSTPDDRSADAIMYVTVDIFGINRSRFDAYLYNQETLRAETSFEMFAMDRNGQIILAPRNANREAKYAEHYVLWAGPFVTNEKVRQGKGLLIDFSDVDGNPATYKKNANKNHPIGSN